MEIVGQRGTQRLEVGKIYKGVHRLINSVWTTTFVPTADGKVIILSYNRDDKEGYEREYSLLRAHPIEDDDRNVIQLAVSHLEPSDFFEVKNVKHVFDYKMPDAETIANDPDLRHLRGQMMSKKFFGESKILSFEQFLNEDEDKKDFAVADLFSSLGRNYTTDKVFYTDLLQFIVDREKKHWRNPREYVELEKSITAECEYSIRFTLDSKKYSVNIVFDIVFSGKKEKDAPDTGYDVMIADLSVVLEEIRIKKIEIKSSSLNYSSSDPNAQISRSCEDFLLKVLKNDYDALGSKIYRMEQK